MLTELIKAQFVPYYWNSTGKAELDFLVQAGSTIIPFEVKASTNKRAKSLPVYLAKYRPKQAVKIWLGNYGITEKESTEMVSLPHYFISALPSLLNQE